MRIAALRKEERDKTADLEEKIEAIERVMSSLSERMRPIQELMETDEVSFIQVGMSDGVRNINKKKFLFFFFS